MDRLRKNDHDKAVFVVNPRSGGGATSRRMAQLEQSLGRYFEHAEIRVTERPRHATDLAAEAVESGATLVVAVGGDGTANEVANGLFDGQLPRSESVVFTVVPAGTGSDFVRTLGMPSDLDAAVRIAAFGPDRQADAAYATFVDESGGQQARIHINVSGFGVNGAVVARANRSSKRWGGMLTFAGATVASVATYRPVPTQVQWTLADGSDGSWQGDLLGAFVANGAYCGGGMWIGRDGAIDDGLLDLVLIPRMGALRLAMNAPRLYTGRLDGAPGVIRAQVRRVTAHTPSPHPPPLVDLDGEAVGSLPFTVTVLSKTLNIRGVWG